MLSSTPVPMPGLSRATSAPLAGTTGGGNSSGDGTTAAPRGSAAAAGGGTMGESTANMNESISILKGAASVFEAMQQSMQQSLALQTSFVTGNQGSSAVSGLTEAGNSAAYGVWASSSFSVSDCEAVDPQVALHALKGGAMTAEQQEGIWATKTKTYYDVVKAMKESVSIEDRTYLFTTYEQSFLGSEAVTFIQQHLELESRQQALEVGLAMEKKIHCWKHVCGDHELKDQYLFYEFTNFPQQMFESIHDGEPEGEGASSTQNNNRKKQLVSQPSWRQVNANKVQDLLSKHRNEKNTLRSKQDAATQNFDPFGVLLDSSAKGETGDNLSGGQQKDKPLNQLFSDSFAFATDVQATHQESDAENKFFGGGEEAETKNMKGTKGSTTTKSLLPRPLPMSEACRSRSAPLQRTNSNAGGAGAGHGHGDNKKKNNNSDVSCPVTTAVATATVDTTEFVNAATTVTQTAKMIRARTNRSRSRTRSISPCARTSRASTLSTISTTGSGSPPSMDRRRTVSPSAVEQESWEEEAMATATAAAEALQFNTTGASRRSTATASRVSGPTRTSAAARSSTRSSRSPSAGDLTMIAKRSSKRVMSPVPISPKTEARRRTMSKIGDLLGRSSDHGAPYAVGASARANNNKNYLYPELRRASSAVVPRNTTELFPSAPQQQQQRGLPKRTASTGSRMSNRSSAVSQGSSYKKRFSNRVSPPSIPRRTRSTGSARGSTGIVVVPSNLDDDDIDIDDIDDERDLLKRKSSSGGDRRRGRSPTSQQPAQPFPSKVDVEEFSWKRTRSKSDTSYMKYSSATAAARDARASSSSRYSAITMPTRTAAAPPVTPKARKVKSGDLLSSSDHGVSRYVSIINTATTKRTVYPVPEPPAITPKAEGGRRKIKSGDLLSTSDHGGIRSSSSGGGARKSTSTTKRSVSPVSPNPEGGRRGRFSNKSGDLLSSSDHGVSKETRSIPRRAQSTNVVSSSSTRKSTKKMKRSLSPTSGRSEKALPGRTNSHNGKRTSSNHGGDKIKKSSSSSSRRGRSPRRSANQDGQLRPLKRCHSDTTWIRNRGPLTPIPEKRVSRGGPSRHSKSPSRQRSSNVTMGSKTRISKSSSPKGTRRSSKDNRRRSPEERTSATKISLTREESSGSLDNSKKSSDELDASSMHSYFHTMTRPQRAIAKELESIGIKLSNVKKLKKKIKKNKDKKDKKEKLSESDSETDTESESTKTKLKKMTKMTKKAAESIGNKTQSFTAMADFTKKALAARPKTPSKYNSLPDFNGLYAPMAKLTDSAVSKANATWKSTTKRTVSEPAPLMGENHRTKLLGGSNLNRVSASLTPMSENPLGLKIRLRSNSAQNLHALLSNGEQR